MVHKIQKRQSNNSALYVHDAESVVLTVLYIQWYSTALGSHSSLIAGPLMRGGATRLMMDDGEQ